MTVNIPVTTLNGFIFSARENGNAVITKKMTVTGDGNGVVIATSGHIKIGEENQVDDGSNQIELKGRGSFFANAAGKVDTSNTKIYVSNGSVSIDATSTVDTGSIETHLDYPGTARIFGTVGEGGIKIKTNGNVNLKGKIETNFKDVYPTTVQANPSDKFSIIDVTSTNGGVNVDGSIVTNSSVILSAASDVMVNKSVKLSANKSVNNSNELTITSENGNININAAVESFGKSTITSKNGDINLNSGAGLTFDKYEAAITPAPNNNVLFKAGGMIRIDAGSSVAVYGADNLTMTAGSDIVLNNPTPTDAEFRNISVQRGNSEISAGRKISLKGAFKFGSNVSLSSDATSDSATGSKNFLFNNSASTDSSYSLSTKGAAIDFTAKGATTLVDVQSKTGTVTVNNVGELKIQKIATTGGNINITNSGNITLLGYGNANPAFNSLSIDKPNDRDSEINVTAIQGNVTFGQSTSDPVRLNARNITIMIDENQSVLNLNNENDRNAYFSIIQNDQDYDIPPGSRGPGF